MAIGFARAVLSASWLFVPRSSAQSSRTFALLASRCAAASSPIYMSSTGPKLFSSAAPRNATFSYSVAASYIAKDRPYDPSTHVFHFNPYNRLQQHGGKRAVRPESGQDAFFVSRLGSAGGVALGVADGVGGWMESGVDPADFSHGLCEYMAEAAHDHSREAESASSLTARRLMELGYRAVRRDRSIRAGGSTAVVGLLTPDGTLEVANLGDSGFIHLRLNAVHACSEPQTHAFNTPFQLSEIPPNLLARMAAFGGAQLSDEPRDAEVTRHALRHGDVLVFASDGVWDNLFNQELLQLVSRAMMATGAWQRDAATSTGTGTGTGTGTDTGAENAEDGSGEVRVAPDLAPLTDPAGPSPPSSSTTSLVTLQSLIATRITAAAKQASLDTKRDGPFAKEVKRYYPHEVWHGGKVDDICVVVVVVSETAAAPDDPLPKSRL